MSWTDFLSDISQIYFYLIKEIYILFQLVWKKFNFSTEFKNTVLLGLNEIIYN